MDTEGLEPKIGKKEIDLMGRAAELFQDFNGPKWSEIAKTLKTEGFMEEGKPLSSNAIRKRFQKDPVLRILLEDYRQGKLQPRQISALRVPKEHLEKKTVLSQSLGRMDRDNTVDHTLDETVTAKSLLDLLQGSMQRRDEILIEQIRTSNTMGDTRILREIEEKMKLMETRISELDDRLTILVEDKVEEILRTIVNPGGSFARDLEPLVVKIIEEKISGEVGTLLSAVPMTPGQGPGRSEGEGKMARFSATMPQHLYDQLKTIEGDASFSSRLATAVDFYLRALAAQKGNTEYDRQEG